MYAYQSEFASIRLANGFADGDGEQIFATLERIPKDQFEECFNENEIHCNAKSPYRTFDGRCNNLEEQAWGSANTGGMHAVFPAYEDGISAPRDISVSSLVTRMKSSLPSARDVSVTMSGGQARPDTKITMLTMQLAQFTAHDLINTPMELIEDPNREHEFILPACCHVNADCRHPSCFPIGISPNDPFYGQHRKDCMEFIRSQPSGPRNCQLGPRTPNNLNSHFLDGSAIYGSSLDKSRELRSRHGGRLRINGSPSVRPTGCVMPPEAPNSMSCHAGGGGSRPCMMSGDSRVNQHTGMISITSLFIREHNRIADYLSNNIEDLPDETIYQVTRRIMIAQIQHIVYHELLPVLLGPKIYRDVSNNLVPKAKGFCDDCYDVTVNPSISVEFGAAGFRLHSIAPGWLPTKNRTGGFVPIYEHMLNPEIFYKENGVNEILSGLVQLPSDSFDPIVSFHLQNHLFRMVNKPYGQDILSFNIQRGRDQGVASYAEVREACGLPSVGSFADLEDLMSPAAVKNLAQVYMHVRDIDLYAGGISEYPVNGGEGVVGPTFACLIVDQFKRLKTGDRFYYENKQAKFTAAELAQIKKVSLSALLCGNEVGMDRVQRRALLQDSPTNQIVSCEDITRDAPSLEPFLDNITPDKFPDVAAEDQQPQKRRNHGGSGQFGGGPSDGPGGPGGPGGPPGPPPMFGPPGPPFPGGPDMFNRTSEFPSRRRKWHAAHRTSNWGTIGRKGEAAASAVAVVNQSGAVEDLLLIGTANSAKGEHT
jgi:hypothetical protein